MNLLLEIGRHPVIAAVVIVYLAALVGVWRASISPSARLLWSCELIFLPGAGLLAWLLTRGTSHGPWTPPAETGDERVVERTPEEENPGWPI